ncbi:MAG: AAA family ATPase [Candidatus Hodarchaeota archaeon]
MSKNKCKIICITGGKGGTGKTLCAVNLAVMFKNEGKKVLLIDGDVENPNTYLLLNGILKNKQDVTFFKPKIVEDKCSKCGLCAQNCLANALLHIKDAFPIPILTVCSGCKLCYKICPENAIEEDSKTIGWIYSTKVNNLSLFLGELKPSEARSAAIVEALLEKLDRILENKSDNFDIIILDTAPGAHCDVELLIAYADKVIPITEPTKFGKLDLIRIMELIKLLDKKARVIVNRSSLLGFREQFLNELEKENITILGDIPLDSDIVESYCHGTPLMEENSKYDKQGAGYIAFTKIYKSLKEWLEINNDI